MDKVRKLSDYRFLIIAGTSKAGTTSVFNYLAGHPEVCPSKAKETRFFLDPDYPLSSRWGVADSTSEKRYARDGPNAYLCFFDRESIGSGEAWRLEATPDYLYSANTPHVIHQTLANVRFIFILREPVSRLLSFYQFGKAMNEIPMTMSFDRYIELQRNNSRAERLGEWDHPAFCALQHGRYSVYLKPFFTLFGKSVIHVGFQEDLCREPVAFMRSVCQFAGVDERYFENYSFRVSNKSVQVRNPRLHQIYHRAKQRLRVHLRDIRWMRYIFRQIGNRMDALYRNINVTESGEITMSRSTKDFVFGYYKDEPARLKEMLGVDVPWPSP